MDSTLKTHLPKDGDRARANNTIQEVLNESPLIQSYMSQYISTEDPTTATRSMNELKEQLTKIAHHRLATSYAKTKRGGAQDAADYALSLMAIGPDMAQSGQRSMTILQDRGVPWYSNRPGGRNKFPIAIDSSVAKNLDMEAISDYLFTQKLERIEPGSLWREERDWVKEFDIDPQWAPEEITNSNIKDNGYWTLNPDGKTVSLYGIQGDGAIGVYRNRQGEPVTVDLTTFEGKDDPRYKALKEASRLLTYKESIQRWVPVGRGK